jgi:predicted aspartyl protease
LVLPRKLIRRLELAKSSFVDGVLADGTETIFELYSWQVEWMDGLRQIEVIATEGETALLCVGMLIGNELHIDYANAVLTLAPGRRMS